MEHLVFQTHPKVLFATNTFIDVPVILQYDDTPLISIIREQLLGFTTEIPIFHPDGTYLAKVKGNRIYATEDGKKAGLTLREPKGMTVCELDGNTLFELSHQTGDSFKASAELYTSTGCFVKFSDSNKGTVIKNDGEPLFINGVYMSGNVFVGSQIGIWVRSDGGMSIG